MCIGFSCGAHTGSGLPQLWQSSTELKHDCCFNLSLEHKSVLLTSSVWLWRNLSYWGSVQDAAPLRPRASKQAADSYSHLCGTASDSYRSHVHLWKAGDKLVFTHHWHSALNTLISLFECSPLSQSYILSPSGGLDFILLLDDHLTDQNMNMATPGSLKVAENFGTWCLIPCPPGQQLTVDRRPVYWDGTHNGNLRNHNLTGML